MPTNPNQSQNLNIGTPADPQADDYESPDIDFQSGLQGQDDCFLPQDAGYTPNPNELQCGILFLNEVVAERPDSGKLTFNKSGCTGTRKYQVPWFDPNGPLTYLDYVSLLLGQVQQTPAGTPSVTLPAIFSPALPFLFCREVDVEGEDQLGPDACGNIRFRRAILTCKYMPLDMEESFHVTAHAITLPRYRYAYIGTNAANLAVPDAWVLSFGSGAVGGTFAFDISVNGGGNVTVFDPGPPDAPYDDNVPFSPNVVAGRIEIGLERILGPGNVTVQQPFTSDGKLIYGSYFISIRTPLVNVLPNDNLSTLISAVPTAVTTPVVGRNLTSLYLVLRNETTEMTWRFFYTSIHKLGATLYPDPDNQQADSDFFSATVYNPELPNDASNDQTTPSLLDACKSLLVHELCPEINDGTANLFGTNPANSAGASIEYGYRVVPLFSLSPVATNNNINRSEIGYASNEFLVYGPKFLSADDVIDISWTGFEAGKGWPAHAQDSRTLVAWLVYRTTSSGGQIVVNSANADIGNGLIGIVDPDTFDFSDTGMQGLGNLLPSPVDSSYIGNDESTLFALRTALSLIDVSLAPAAAGGVRADPVVFDPSKFIDVRLQNPSATNDLQDAPSAKWAMAFDVNGYNLIAGGDQLFEDLAMVPPYMDVGTVEALETSNEPLGPECTTLTWPVNIRQAASPRPDILDEPATKLMPSGEFSLQRHMVLTPHFEMLLNLLGHVNRDTFLWFPPWTLLLQGFEAKRAYLPTGERVWDIHFKFLYNPMTHNALYRGDRGRYEFVRAIGFVGPNGQPITGNVGKLLKPAVMMTSDGKPTGQPMAGAVVAPNVATNNQAQQLANLQAALTLANQKGDTALAQSLTTSINNLRAQMIAGGDPAGAENAGAAPSVSASEIQLTDEGYIYPIGDYGPILTFQ